MEIILIVEDLVEEQQKAKEAAMRHGFRPAITATLEDAMRIWQSLEGKLVGIVTDLHFPEKTSENPEWSDANKPCGLAIVAEATRRGISVVVCSDINHHFAEYVTKVLTVLQEFHPDKHIPMTMNSKNWDRAMENLARLLKNKKEAQE
jgi:hypothetical protein